MCLAMHALRYQWNPSILPLDCGCPADDCGTLVLLSFWGHLVGIWPSCLHLEHYGGIGQSRLR